MVDWIERVREWLSRRPFRGPEPREEAEPPERESDREEAAESRR